MTAHLSTAPWPPAPGFGPPPHLTAAPKNRGCLLNGHHLPLLDVVNATAHNPGFAGSLLFYSALHGGANR